jgi:aarF domain-containing kinase
VSRGVVPADVWRRGKSVIALAAGVASQELRHKVRSGFASSSEKVGASELRARIEQAKLMAESLGRLKGALMKAGQLLSIDASELLPPEAAEILAKLQGQAEPVDFEVLHGVLVAELGEQGVARLEHLDTTPAAAASIGQVHRASVEGRPVAVKIQYPGIAESIDSDIALIEKLGASWLSLTRSQMDLAGVFEELRTVLHFEADYVRERAYLDRFGALVAGDRRFVVPKSVPSLSSRRVLTMSWEDGAPLGAWARTGPRAAERVALGRAMLDLYCDELLTWGVVQTDPNFGNFLVRDDGRIVLLDFGASVEYDEAFRATYVELLRAVASGRSERIVERAIDFGLLDPREDGEARALFGAMMLFAAAPFEERRQPFAFGDSDYAAKSRDLVTRFTKSLVYSPPPRRLIFLHRKLGGLFQLLKRLDVELDLVPYWRRMLG